MANVELQPSPNIFFAIPSSFLNRSGIEELFRDYDISLKFASNPHVLMELLNTHQPTALFIDTLFSPDVIDLLKRTRSLSKLKIFLISEQLKTNEEKLFLSLGVDEILHRPISSDILLKKCAQLARLKSEKLAPNVSSHSQQNPQKIFRSTLGSEPLSPKKKIDPVLEFWLGIYRNQAPELSMISDKIGSLVSRAKTIPKAGISNSQRRELQVFQRSLEGLNYQRQIKVFEDRLKAFVTRSEALRAVVLSLKPYPLWQSSECPRELFVLASSDFIFPNRSRSIHTVHVPLVAVAFQKQEALYVLDTPQSEVMGNFRPGDLICRGKPETAQAAIPVFGDDETLLAMLYVQFSKFGPLQISQLTEFATEMQEWASFFMRGDFLARTYRGDLQESKRPIGRDAPRLL